MPRAAVYLAKYRYFGEPHLDIRVEQVHEIGWPSLLSLHAEDSGGKGSVSVGSRDQSVAREGLV